MAVFIAAIGFALPQQALAVAASAVYVDIRENDAPDARVTERWRLYSASHALVIGIDNYNPGWPRLSNAIKDAKLVAAALEKRGFTVQLLTDVGGDDLRRTLRQFFALKGADPEARLFLWFAGHGHTELDEGYIVPADAPSPGSPEFRFSALHMGDIGSMVRLARAKHVFAVFDSCFAGTIFNAQRARPPAAITRAVARPTRQFLTSGDAEQKVSDDGTFRKLFLSALNGEERADANRDGYLTGSEVSAYLEDRVTNLTRAVQTPRGGKLRDPKFDRGDFVFVLPERPGQEQVARAAPKSAQPAVRAATPVQQLTGPTDAAFDLAFWEAIKDSKNAADYQAYLETYPKGRFVALARLRAKSAAAPAKTAKLEAKTAAPAKPEPVKPAPAKVQPAKVEPVQAQQPWTPRAPLPGRKPQLALLQPAEPATRAQATKAEPSGTQVVPKQPAKPKVALAQPKATQRAQAKPVQPAQAKPVQPAKSTPSPSPSSSGEQVANAPTQDVEPDESPDLALKSYIRSNRRTVEKIFKKFARQKGLIGFSDKFLRVYTMEVLSSKGSEHVMSVYFFYCEKDYGCNQISSKVPVVASFDGARLAFLRKFDDRGSDLPQTKTGSNANNAIEFSGGF